ncbi:MAG: nitrate ABC transporter substrate-binding protein [Candidatus Dactylopiibacterium carminicum]|nr:MAG: nitrate ABC transporter substrate-binding protein [Candidatus Dactylopiibacterium carminicum]
MGNQADQQILAPSSGTLIEAYYTICPVFVASNIAVELGWLDEEFRRAGASAVYLRSLPDNAGWLPHYRHSLPRLFRDGGAIPTIHARADLANTYLIASTFTQTGGKIIVRADAGIRRVADLKGRRIGLSHSLNTEKIDFTRITAQRGILLALQLAGLGEQDVEIVDTDEADTPVFQPAVWPFEFWQQFPSTPQTAGADLQALREGRVDAVYGHETRAASLVASGEFTVIEDLSRHPDWTLNVANAPFTTAVNADFAEAHPEVVIAFLRAAIRAGRWINANRAAAAEIFARVTIHRDPALIASLIAGYDFVPTLSAQNLAGLEIQKRFLLERGYIRNDFSIREWARPGYLEQALASLAA